MNNSGIDWNVIKSGRSEARRLFPSILNLPVLNSHREILVDIIKNDCDVLDVGANDRSLYDYIDKNVNHGVNYFSCDIDRTYQHDYYNIEDVVVEYDIVTMFEVIEHVDIGSAYALLKKTYDIVKSGGIVILSTPNVYNPVRFWRDCTHITPFAYDELIGIMMSVGFSRFEVYRVKSNMSFRKWLIYKFYKPLINLLGVDFATGIVVVAYKN